MSDWPTHDPHCDFESYCDDDREDAHRALTDERRARGVLYPRRTDSQVTPVPRRSPGAAVTARGTTPRR